MNPEIEIWLRAQLIKYRERVAEMRGLLAEYDRLSEEYRKRADPNCAPFDGDADMVTLRSESEELLRTHGQLNCLHTRETLAFVDMLTMRVNL